MREKLLVIPDNCLRREDGIIPARSILSFFRMKQGCAFMVYVIIAMCIPFALFNKEILMKFMPLKLSQLMLISSLMIPTLSFAKTWGLGAVIGAPTGLSGNYFFSETRTLHTTLAYDFDGDDDLQLASHYQWRMNNLDFEGVKFGWFYGFGARFAFKDNDHHNHHKHNHHDDEDLELGPSGTLGLFHEFQEIPLEAFLKGNLTVNVIEDTDVDADIMLGLHYNF